METNLIQEEKIALSARWIAALFSSVEDEIIHLQSLCRRFSTQRFKCYVSFFNINSGTAIVMRDFREDFRDI